jgi:hypothetical protein
MSSNRKRRLSFAGSVLAAAILVVLSCRLGPTRRGWNEQWGPVPPHRTFPGDCGICHVGEGRGKVRKDLSFDHEKETGHRQEAAHSRAACLRCHNDRGPVTAYVARGCGGCHGDPHGSALGSDCESCHGQASWKPVKSAAKDVQKRFHAIPAHTVPPCATCHVEAGVSRPQVGPAQCGPCHQNAAQ